jgi:synaptobrevin family protein YKT6
MVKVLNISIYKYDEENPIRLASSMNDEEFSYNYFSRMYTSKIYEIINFSTRLAVKCTPPGLRQTIEIDDIDFVTHTYVAQYNNNILGATFVTDKLYPKINAYRILSQVLNFYSKNGNSININNTKEDKFGSELRYDWLDDLLMKCKKTNEMDKITQVNIALDEVKEIMTRNIEEVLKRGDKIDDLIKKSAELSDDAKKFKDNAAKLNSICGRCVIL